MDKNGTIIACSDNSFFQKKLFKMKVNAGLKQCESVKQDLSKKGLVDKNDFKINLLVADFRENDIKEKLIATKGYESDGKLKPLTVYGVRNGRAIYIDSNVDIRVLVVDLYEKSIYLHSYSIVNGYAEGYIVQNASSENGLNLIFTREKVKVFMKNSNTYYEFSNINEFIDKYIM